MKIQTITIIIKDENKIELISFSENQNQNSSGKHIEHFNFNQENMSKI